MRMVFGYMMKMKVGSLLEETYTHCFSGGGHIRIYDMSTYNQRRFWDYQSKSILNLTRN